ncbi:MAG: hypothetical protein L3K02_03700, partial [Thermoplasmata archaeon]|nr:hypothetical protein [Thermoplasmata archaeon]
MTRIRFNETTTETLRSLIQDHDEIAVFQWDNPPKADWGWDDVPQFRPIAPLGRKVLEVATTSEAERTALRQMIEDIKPWPKSGPTIHLRARKYLDSDTDGPGVYLEVTNNGTTPIRELTIEWVYGCDPPKRCRFALREGEVKRPLQVGEMRLYVFPSELTREMCSVVQSVSADLYSVQATKDGIEETAIPGRDWG